MKILKFTLYVLLPFTFLACQKESLDPLPEKPQIQALQSTTGNNFRQVGFNYEVMEDNIQYVNRVGGVETINDQPNGFAGEHWVYESPSLDGKEIGFSVVYPEIFEGQEFEVVLFLHGSEGSENSGSALFWENYLFNYRSHKRVLIFANGIYAPDSPIPSGVWKLRELDGLSFNHPAQLLELIKGIMDSPTLFPFIKKDRNSWSVCGFSAGASGTMGVFMDPLFMQNSQYQPRSIFPLGGWMTESLSQYFDFDGGYVLLNDCDNAIVELTIANHVKDDVDCVGLKQYDRRSWLTDRFDLKDVPYTYLGLRDISNEPCDDDSNPVHSVKFYLRNSIPNSLKEVTCRNPDYLDAFNVLGEILYRP